MNLSSECTKNQSKIPAAKKKTPKSVTPIDQDFPLAGFVYVAINEFIPDICKVGMTKKMVSKRMKSLSGTSVPGAYVAHGFAWSTDCRALEKDCHLQLDNYRLDPRKEFFTCQPDYAVSVLMALHKQRQDDEDESSESFSNLRMIDIYEDEANGIERGIL